MSYRKLALVVGAFLFLIGPVAANPQADDRKEERRSGPGVEDNQSSVDEEAVQDFFDELDEVVKLSDRLPVIVRRLQNRIKTEFQLLQTQRDQLADKSAEHRRDAVLRDQQLVLAQKFNGLEEELIYGVHHDHLLRNQIAKRVHVFTKQHPKVARLPEFQKKYQEILRGLMRGGGNFPKRIQGVSLSDTLDELSGGQWRTREQKRRETEHVHPASIEGPIQESRSALQALLKLKWNGDSLDLDRQHWDAAFARKTSAAIAQSVQDLLNAEGWVVEDQAPQRMALRPKFQRDISNVNRLFNELRNTAGVLNYNHSGRRHSFSGAQIEATLETDVEQFKLTVEERTGPKRLLRISSDSESLEVLIVGELVLRFMQKPDGSVLISELWNAEATTHEFSSFSEFYSKHPRIVEERFFALLDHMGVLIPAQRFDEPVVNRVAERLSMDTVALRADVEDLIQQLDSNRYAERKSAFEKLSDDLDLYYSFVREFANDPLQSREVRWRVGTLMEMAQANEKAQIDELICALDLENDELYLDEASELTSHAAAREIFQRRIQELQVD